MACNSVILPAADRPLQSLGKKIGKLPAIEIETALRVAVLAAMNGDEALCEAILSNASAQLYREGIKKELEARAGSR
jgi:hypothetical protein